MPDVRRHEVAARILLDQGVARTRWSGTPEGDAIVVVVIGEGREASLASMEPGRLAVAQSLLDVGPGQAQAADAVEA